MKNIKKTVACVMAVAAMATSLVGISASAAVKAIPTLTKTFNVGSATVTGSVTFNTGTYYYATTSCPSSTVNKRTVDCYAYTNTPSTLYAPQGSSQYGTATCTLTPNPNEPGQLITKFYSTHVGKSSTTSNSTYFAI